MRLNRPLAILLLALLPALVHAQPKAGSGDEFLREFIHKHLSSFKKIIDNPAKYRLQVIYTRIDRDAKNKPVLTTFYYRNLPKEFFSPASMVKLPLSAMTLEKIGKLNVAGMTRDSRFAEDSNYRCQRTVITDPLAPDSIPRLSAAIREALIVSDNEAYNRMYEFLGQKAINDRLHELGYTTAKVTQRFTLCDSVANRYTNGFSFFDGSGKMVYRQASAFNPDNYPMAAENPVIGKAYLNEYNRKINTGMDFTTKNFLPLKDIDDILKRIIFPQIYPENKRFRLKPEELDFMRYNMAITPAESGFPAFKKKRDYWDALTNYLYYGSEEDAVLNPDIRIFNIVGQSFGFLSDCAYITDFRHGVEFSLSVTLYVNEDGVLNDGKYDYKELGFPFLKQLGRAMYEYELGRARKVKPDLGEFSRLFTERSH
jgi:hypothetical protein